MLWAALNIQYYHDWFLILEDDAKLTDDWMGKADDAIKSVPKDWDMLYIGSCCCEGKPSKLIKNQVWEVRYPLCTHAYFVAKKALPVLLETNRKMWAPIDIGLTYDSHPLLKVYTVLPRIVEQFDTDIPA